jgi:hypothetical protein
MSHTPAVLSYHVTCVFCVVCSRTVFSALSGPRLYYTRPNASIVVLRVVGGDEKGSLESEMVKYGRQVPRDSGPRMTALARVSSYVNDRLVLSSERALHINKPATI